MWISVQSASQCSRQMCKKRAWVRDTLFRRDNSATVCSHSFQLLNHSVRMPTWSRNIMARLPREENGAAAAQKMGGRSWRRGRDESCAAQRDRSAAVLGSPQTEGPSHGSGAEGGCRRVGCYLYSDDAWRRTVQRGRRLQPVVSQTGGGRLNLACSGSRHRRPIKMNRNKTERELLIEHGWDYTRHTFMHWMSNSICPFIPERYDVRHPCLHLDTSFSRPGAKKLSGIMTTVLMGLNEGRCWMTGLKRSEDKSILLLFRVCKISINQNFTKQTLT